MKHSIFIMYLCISFHLYPSDKNQTLTEQQKAYIALLKTQDELQYALQIAQNPETELFNNTKTLYNQILPNEISDPAFKAFRLTKSLHRNQRLLTALDHNNLEQQIVGHKALAQQKLNTHIVRLALKEQALKSQYKSIASHPITSDTRHEGQTKEAALDKVITTTDRLSPIDQVESVKSTLKSQAILEKQQQPQSTTAAIVSQHARMKRRKKETTHHTDSQEAIRALQRAKDIERNAAKRGEAIRKKMELDKQEQVRRLVQREQQKKLNAEKAKKIAEEKKKRTEKEAEEKIFLEDQVKEWNLMTDELLQMDREDFLSQAYQAIEKERRRTAQIILQIDQMRIQKRIINDLFTSFIKGTNKQNIAKTLLPVLKKMAEEEDIDHPFLDTIIQESVIRVALKNATELHLRYLRLNSGQNTKMTNPDDYTIMKQEYFRAASKAWETDLHEFNQRRNFGLSEPVMNFLTKIYKLVLYPAINLPNSIYEELSPHDQFRSL